MKTLKLTAVASVFAGLLIAQTVNAQQRNIPVPASSVGGGGVAAVAITPLTSDDVRAVLSSAGGAGATVLPFQLPPGTYRNAASYPLMLASVVANRQDGSVIVNGQQVASNRVRDSGTWATMTGVVPAGATFTLNSANSASVTAMANGATWQQTGIRFAVNGGVYVTTQVDEAPMFRNVFDCIYTVAGPVSEFGFDPTQTAVLLQGSPCGRRTTTLLRHVAGWVNSGVFLANTSTTSNSPVAYNSAVVRGAYSRNIREGVGVCRAELRQGDNWGTTATTWSGEWVYPQAFGDQLFTRDLCNPVGAANIRNTGRPVIPPPIFESL